MVLMAAPAKIIPSSVLVRTGSQTVLNFQKFENRELEPSVLSCSVRPVPVLRSSSEQNFGNTKYVGIQWKLSLCFFADLIFYAVLPRGDKAGLSLVCNTSANTLQRFVSAGLQGGVTGNGLPAQVIQMTISCSS